MLQYQIFRSILSVMLCLASSGFLTAKQEPKLSEGPANLFLMAILANSSVSRAQEEPQLTVEQQKGFLLDAKVVKVQDIRKGINSIKRYTMTDGRITHDAHFEVGSYQYNLAAYELAQLVGLGDMMPVTVERKLFGQTGALDWWLPVQMDEAERLRKKIDPPDPTAWNHQIYRMRVFAQLVYDTNRNSANILYGKDWKLYMVDFTRAFRLYRELENPKNLIKCSRELLDKLRKLDEAQLTARTKKYLSPPEIQGVMARRDKIVAHFEKLIAEKGEAQVLY